MTILTPTPMNGQVAADRAKFAHQFRLSAGLGKAADALCPTLCATAQTKQNAVVLARMAVLYTLSDLNPSMTVAEVLSVLAEGGR